ncbi:MAG: head GIN domain-containing protein [Sphingorhabdus sp.]
MPKETILFPLAALLLSACGYSVFDAAEDIKEGTSDFSNAKSITDSAAVTDSFTRLKAMGPDNIIFVTGTTFSIKASGNADSVAKLRYRVEDGTIIIGREKGKYWGKNSEGATITVTAPTLAKASLAGSGDFSADKMTGDKVVVEIAGSGNLTVTDLVAKEVESNIAGSGDVKLAGKVDKADYDVAGSGSIDAAKLASTNADVSIAGSGNVSLTATGKVDAEIAGSGEITVAGGAKCSSSTIGSGRINCT